ncbi:MAG: histidine kinase dimerization/phosphoacceptor domain -containing protein [Hyphomonadaceae bacterium]|nr:histidine kinase dimerization/phosphoacceptor domain -containing protein [Hyphomonadaceae bacterium]
MKPKSGRRFSYWPSALSLQSLRGRIALLLGMAMLPAGAIAMQVGLNAVAAHRAGIEESISRRALQSLEVERDVFHQTRELLRVLATSPALQSLESTTCRAWLREVVAEYDYVATIAVSTDEGAIVCSIPEAPPDFVAPRTELRSLALERNAYTMAFVDRGSLSGRPVIGALEPLRDSRGGRLGFVGASIDIDEFRNLLERGRGVHGARTALVDSAGRVLVDTGSPSSAGAAALPSTDEIRARLSDRTSFLPVHGGSAVIVPLQHPDLYAVMVWPEQGDPLTRWLQLGLPVAAPLLIWLLAVTAGWFAIEIYVARPLSALETTARSLARGEEVEDAAALTNAPVEVRSLRRTLAAMAKTLRGREARLVEALGEERALLREVHHRVKNNLQMVASLLNIQARSARDESEAWGLARAHDRVQLLALVHQRIYASGEVREVRLDDLVGEMARQLLQARPAQAKAVELNMQLGPGRANADRTVPLAFLIGEAFSAGLDDLGDEGGALEMQLVQDELGEVRFAIAVSGSGTGHAPSPGVRLIDAFARQLGARLGRRDHPFILWAVVPPPATP